jgi:hypothetical protein
VRNRSDRYAEKAVSDRGNMVFHHSILSRSQKREPNSEIPKSPQLQQKLQILDRQAKGKLAKNKGNCRGFS